MQGTVHHDIHSEFNFMSQQVELSLQDGELVADAPWLVAKGALQASGLKFRKGKWRTTPNWVTLRRMRTLFGDRLNVSDEVQKWAADDAAKWAIPSAEFRDLAAEVDPVLPTLMHHQNVGGHWLHAVHYGLLCDQPRVGKVGSVIAAHVLNGRGPLLWIGPKGTLIDIKRQFLKHLPDAKVAIAEGTKAQRVKVFESDAEIILVSYNSLSGHTRLAPYGSIKLKRCGSCGGQEGDEFCVPEDKCQVHQREANRPWQTVVVDECHALKDPKAQRTRAIWAVGKEAENRYGLSGTPVANSLQDLWALLHFILPDEWTGRSTYIDNFLNTWSPPWGGIEIRGLNPATTAEFRSLTDPRILRRVYEQIHGEMIIPDPQVRYVELKAAEMKRYAELKKDWITDDAFVMSPLELSMRLHQMATISMDQIDGEWIASGKCHKLDAILEIAEELDDEPFVVFVVHKPLAKMIHDGLADAGISSAIFTGDIDATGRQAAIDAFNGGQVRVFIGTYATASEGVDLSVADTIVRVQRPWSMIQDEQAAARTMSPIKGGIKPLLIDIVTSGTIDEQVRMVLDDKAESLEEVCQDRGRLAAMISLKVPT